MKRVLILAAAILAVGGGVATAGTLITSKQIKNGTIKTKDISSKAKRALKGNTGPRGFTGPQGPQGPQGPAGPSVTGQAHYVQSGQVPFGDEVVQSATVFCPAGEKVLGGGGAVVGDTMNVTTSTGDRAGWGVIGIDLTFEGGEYVQATAICAPTGRAVVSGSRARGRAKIERMAEKIGRGRTRR